MKSEILAPASSSDMVRFAVQNGANAVYLGLKEFNARRKAGNFTLDELKSEIGFCHIRGVSVYLTVNIIIKDSELDSAVKLVEDAYFAGIDAVIIADIGLASILRKRFPSLPLHASTQLSIHNSEGAEALRKLGFSRVCLARELSLEEITEIRKNTSIELEVFVHGAHCMSVSGQCYFSAVIGSRSGNRGLCGQICRLPFKNGKTDYALSLKDMSVVDRLPELSKIGINSFKIEGRMKRPEYVAAAVSACKASLEGLNDFVEKFKVLEDVFSRSGFTSGYLDGKLNSDMFGIRRKEDIAEEKLLKQIRNAQKENPLVPVTAEYILKSNQPEKLILSDGKNTVEVEGEIPQSALSKPIDEKEAYENLSKLGGTPYYMTEFAFVSDDEFFRPKSMLNALRRDAVEKLDALRSQVPNRLVNEYEYALTNHQRQSQNLMLLFENANQIPKNARDFEIYLSAFEKVDAFERLLKDGYDIGVTLPICNFKNNNSVEEKLIALKEVGIKKAVCNNIYALSLAKKSGFEIVAGTGLNLFNSLSVAEVEKFGSSKSILSFELAKNELNSIQSEKPVGILAYGNLPLMTVRTCPIMKSCNDCTKKEILTDRLGNKFTVLCKGEYRQILNNVPLAVRNLQNFNVDFAVLSFTTENKDEVSAVISDFYNGIERTGEYTNGLYNRGVM